MLSLSFLKNGCQCAFYTSLIAHSTSSRAFWTLARLMKLNSLSTILSILLFLLISAFCLSLSLPSSFFSNPKSSSLYVLAGMTPALVKSSLVLSSLSKLTKMRKFRSLSCPPQLITTFLTWLYKARVAIDYWWTSMPPKISYPITCSILQCSLKPRMKSLAPT